MEAGAFSDDKVVEASKKLVPILVDCDWGNKNGDISGKYGIRGYPTIIFADPEGKEIGRLKDRSAEGAAKEIEEAAAKFKGGGTIADSWDAAVEQAKTGQKLVGYLFVDDKADSKKLEEALGDASLKELLEKIVFVKGAIKSEEAKRFKVTSGPVILILDPAAEKPEEKPVKKLVGKKTAKELKKDLEGVLKKVETKK